MQRQLKVRLEALLVQRVIWVPIHEPVEAAPHFRVSTRGIFAAAHLRHPAKVFGQLPARMRLERFWTKEATELVFARELALEHGRERPTRGQLIGNDTEELLGHALLLRQAQLVANRAALLTSPMMDDRLFKIMSMVQEMKDTPVPEC